MSNKYGNLSSQFEQSVKDLIERHLLQYEELQRIRKELTEKELTILQLKKELSDSHSNYERLRIAQGLGISEEDKKLAYKRLSGLAREVDNCLALLNE